MPATANQLADQARAGFVMRWLEKASQKKNVKTSELKSFTRKLPAMIQTNGFGQAVAFYYSKREKFEAYGEVYCLLETWLCDGSGEQSGKPVLPAEPHSQGPRLLTALTTSGQTQYRAAQAEAQALLLWAKKMVEALHIDEKETMP